MAEFIENGILTVTENSVLGIRKKSTGKYDVDEKHPFYNQSFNRYTLNGVMFTVNQSDEFVECKEKKELFSAKFKIGQRQVEDSKTGEMLTKTTYELIGFTTKDEELGMGETVAKLKKIYRDAETKEVNEDVLNQLLNG
jgi:hypothetical protein